MPFTRDSGNQRGNHDPTQVAIDLIGDLLPINLASSFHRTTQIEYEVLLQEARLAYYRAACDGRYDPRKAAFNTFANWCVYRHLCDVASSHNRNCDNNHEALPVNLVANDPNPEERLAFLELLRQLPDDARTIVDLILDDGGPVQRSSPNSIRTALRNYLDWSESRLSRAWTVVRMMLRSSVMV